MNKIYQPYTYIVEDTLTGKKYCGSKYGKGVTPENTKDYFGSPGKDSEYYEIIQTRSHTLIKSILGVFATKAEAVADEAKWHALYNVSKNEMFYNRSNQTATGFSNTNPPSEEGRRKISETHKGKIVSAKTRQKISETHKGKIVSVETRQKLSESNIGKLRSIETRLKMSLSKKGKPSHRKGKITSEETKQKISEAKKGKTKL
jgi:hypothetical protein